MKSWLPVSSLSARQIFSLRQQIESHAVATNRRKVPRYLQTPTQTHYLLTSAATVRLLEHDFLSKFRSQLVTGAVPEARLNKSFSHYNDST